MVGCMPYLRKDTNFTVVTLSPMAKDLWSRCPKCYIERSGLIGSRERPCIVSVIAKSSPFTASCLYPALSKAKLPPPDHLGSTASLSPLPIRRMNDYKRKYPSRRESRKRMDPRRAGMDRCNCLRSALFRNRLTIG